MDLKNRNGQTRGPGDVKYAPSMRPLIACTSVGAIKPLLAGDW